MNAQIIFIVWRESVEALLVVGILYAWLKNGGVEDRKGVAYLWGGVALGLVLAGLLGAALLGFSSLLSGDQQDYFQIGMVFVAAILIVQMVVWMRRHGRTLKREMETSLSASASRNHWWGVTILAAVAIAREGSETVIFLYGLGQQATGGMALFSAAIIGFALAMATFYILQLGGKIFSWRRFFQLTEVMLLLLGSGLLLTGVDRLISLEALPALVDPIWDTSRFLDDSTPFGNLVGTLTGYRATPALTTLLAYLAYWAVVIGLLRWAGARPATTSAQGRAHSAKSTA